MCFLWGIAIGTYDPGTSNRNKCILLCCVEVDVIDKSNEVLIRQYMTISYNWRLCGDRLSGDPYQESLSYLWHT